MGIVLYFVDHLYLTSEARRLKVPKARLMWSRVLVWARLIEGQIKRSYNTKLQSR